MFVVFVLNDSNESTRIPSTLRQSKDRLLIRRCFTFCLFTRVSVDEQSLSSEVLNRRVVEGHHSTRFLEINFKISECDLMRSSFYYFFLNFFSKFEYTVKK